MLVLRLLYPSVVLKSCAEEENCVGKNIIIDHSSKGSDDSVDINICKLNLVTVIYM